ncbi:MAG: DUF3365 domain-containing protein [Pirellulaceae bacterium]
MFVQIDNSQVESASAESAKHKLPDPAETSEDALARAKLLHETIKGALLVVHRDFFDDENPHVLPSQSLEDVFEELTRCQGVQVHWLTVDADEMNIHHRPKTDFEKQAIEKIRNGAEQHSGLVDEQFQFVGRIPLANQCLKCHVKQRLNLNERSAGLSITIPVKRSQEPKGQSQQFAPSNHTSVFGN